VFTATTDAGLPFPDMDTLHRWVLEELANILASLRQAAGAPGAPIAVAADLLLGLEPLIEIGFQWHDLEPVSRAVVDAAARAGDRRSEARALCQLVSALLETRQIEEAATLARRAAVLCRETGDVIVLFGVLIASAMIAIRRLDYDDAIAHYDEAIQTIQRQGNQLGEAHARMSAAFALSAVGRSEEAVAACESSLAIFRDFGDDRGQAHTLYQLGLARHDLGRIDAALDSFAESLLVCRAIGLRVWEAYCLFRMAEVHLAADRTADAVSFAEQSLALSRELREEANQGRVLAVLGRGLAGLDQLDRSVACLREAHEILSRLGDRGADDVGRLLRAADAAARTASDNQDDHDCEAG
jgi:tetratricopeptide (TPR) repeat protein